MEVLLYLKAQGKLLSCWQKPNIIVWQSLVCKIFIYVIEYVIETQINLSSSECM